MTATSLNIPRLQEALRRRGLSQNDLAKELEVSRATVSKWFRQGAMPRPNKLMQLVLLLKLPYEEFVTWDTSGDPVVAFRKRGAGKTTLKHIERAQDMGFALKNLVPYLPPAELTQPPTLREPKLESAYLQRVTGEVRKQMGTSRSKPISFKNLVRMFREFQAVLIPVLWGENKAHENAVHIWLPKSDTTAIYLNLDTHAHDFNFWMAHELGHVLSPTLKGDDAEDFADAFAAELLVPDKVAGKIYEDLQRRSSEGGILRAITKWAEQRQVSPITIFEQVAKYAKATGAKPVGIPKKAIYPVTTNFNKKFELISEHCFKEIPPTPEDYIRISEKEFETDFFKALRGYVRDKYAGPGFIQNLMNVCLMDAKSLEVCLKHGMHQAK